MGRYWRTIRSLRPNQLAHRVRLRLRPWGRVRRLRSASVLRPVGPVDPELVRPCDRDVIEDAARDARAGTFAFLGERRSLGEHPFPAPSDASLLWAYHLEYMDYLFDLGAVGDDGTIERLVRARREAGDRGGLETRHPYPISRRVVSLCREIRRSSLLRTEGVLGWIGEGAATVAARLEYDVGGNHLLENGLALVHAGTLFTGRRARQWRATGARILRQGAKEQVGTNGGHYELSASYHARVLAVLLEGGRLAEESGVPPGASYWETVGSMGAWLRGALDPEGQLPLLGDSAREDAVEPTRLLSAVERLCPVRIPAVWRGDRDDPETGWTVFEDTEAGHRLLLDSGPVCPEHLPAHGQADTFTYELHVSRRPIIIDTGIAEYAAGGIRDHDRSTRAHNTVEVDGEDSSEVWSSFRVGRRARVVDRSFRRQGGRGTLRAGHDGYRHLGVAHRRTLSHLEPGLWLVADRLTGRGRHEYVSRIHLHPEVVLEQPAPGVWAAHLAGATLSIVPFGADRVALEEGWHSTGFGRRRRCPVLRLTAEGGGRRFGYVLAAGSGPAPIAALEGAEALVRRGASEHRRSIS